jgi:predicted nucleic acid-binding protein
MGLIVLDAGVVIGLLSARDAHHESSRMALRVRRERADRFVLPASAYAEVLVGPLRLGTEMAAIVDGLVDDLPASVAPADRAIARRAAAIRATSSHRIRLPDALVIATAIELDADEVLTTDGGWPDVDVRVTVLPAAS